MFVQKLNPDGGDDCPVPAGLDSCKYYGNLC